MIKRTAIFVVLALALVACTKPIDTVIPTDKNDWRTKLATVIEKLSEEDQVFFTSYMDRHVIGSTADENPQENSSLDLIPPGTTIGQAITEQKAWVVQQLTKAVEAAELKKAQQAKMNQMVTVTLLDKSFDPDDSHAILFLDRQYFNVRFKNISDKPIASVSGTLVFVNLFDEGVFSLGIDVTETIEPGQSYIAKPNYKYSEFKAKYRTTRNLAESKYRNRFEPTMIMFTDGTSIKVED
jgi:hypothetical protein